MRSCGNCTKCCEGWLQGDVRGHTMYPGKPCFFVTIGVGCNDYENRPQFPCKDFKCEWIVDEELPDEFIPQNKNIIITFGTIDEMWYARLVRAGEKVDKETIDWYINYYYKERSFNMWFEIDGVNYVLGSEEFINKTQIMGYGTLKYDRV